MLKTADEMKAQVEKEGIAFWNVRNCSMCNYPLGYDFMGATPMFDSGCDCTGTQTMNPRTWDDVAETYNMNQPERNPNISAGYLAEVNETWRF